MSEAKCTRPPDEGWHCSRPAGHGGPCASAPAAPTPPRTPAQTLALLCLGLEFAPEPLSGPYRAVESPEWPGCWHVLAPGRGQIIAVLPGLGVDPRRNAATARAMAAADRLLDLTWQARETLAAAARGQDIQQAALHLLDTMTAEIDRAMGQGGTVDAVAGTILCHWCGIVSHHPKDVAERYCGHCRKFHDGGEGEVIDLVKSSPPERHICRLKPGKSFECLCCGWTGHTEDITERVLGDLGAFQFEKGVCPRCGKSKHVSGALALIHRAEEGGEAPTR